MRELPYRFARVPSYLGFLVGLTIVIGGFSETALAQRNGFEHPPIDYLNAEVHDRVAVLAEQLKAGKANLEFDDRHGYLPAVLKALDVPVSSQTLVFSKTSLQLHRISPRRPRALYFNDDVYVGYCQQGDVLEFAATDAQQGATFYTLANTQQESLEFVRDRGGCLSCHASSRTQNVPGYLVRSVFSDAAGRPKLGSGTFTTDHTSEFEDRWGGWYVTGQHGSMRHMGNTICRGDEHEFDRESGANQVALERYFDANHYLSPHSDIVALMVLEHQTQMHNAIAAANYETRQAIYQSYQMNELLERPADHLSESANRRIDSVVDDLVRQLLFCDEFVLTDSVSGSTEFADEFESRGKLDSQHRSLRQFDLKNRMFRYPCSYLIGSDAFMGLPDEARSRTVAKVHCILRGDDQSPEYAHLTATMRKEILEILRDTHPLFGKDSPQPDTVTLK
ncbi:hypothetical protein [Neorhodopirellula pilleata]|uniref:Cytochrome c domain-containing protein n=1 Tax=Neorhodopirellula pilleata TaxID=2714738 RepID=A0A5C5ZWC3_9BACT|nr:hypothetical protein [Neorhodopirellula pilleata]TWT91912.1 hypothetical protein Pla100_49520 [Neorhodopirellula pilleata]